MLIGIDGNEANIKNRVGSNQYAFELLKALRQKESDRRHEFLIYLKEDPRADLPKETKWWKYRVIKPAKLWTQWRLPLDLYIHRPRPDVFFSPGHYAPRWCPMPLVISIMDLGYLHFPEHFTKPVYYQLKNWTERSIKDADHILTISEATKRDIIKKYNVSQNRITVTYPGYRKRKAQSEKRKNEDVKRKYKISGDYILFLGTLKPSKNIEGLLEAYKLLAISDKLLASLVIAGKKGWMYEQIFKKVKELGLEKKVIFTGFVPEEDISSLIKEAKIFVMPSFWEGFGIPAVEAMAMGTPVVAGNAGSLPEVIGGAGILIDPHDARDIAKGIKEALEDKSLYNRLRKNGIERAKEFSWQKCAQKTLETLENVAT